MVNQEIVNFANYLADVSGKIIRKYFRQELDEVNKQDQTSVTKADKEVEMALAEEITKKFPDHGIVGEEFGILNNNADYKWIIDPIDGTISFVMGRPIFGTLIALSYKNKPILGIINQPITKERWMGFEGSKATLNNKIIKTKDCVDLNQAVLASTSPFFFQGADLLMLNQISAQTKYQTQGGIIYGGDCYLFGLMALGQVDIIIEIGLKNHDFMALVPIIKSAGGVITNWAGDELDINSEGRILACGDKMLHQKILRQISYF